MDDDDDCRTALTLSNGARVEIAADEGLCAEQIFRRSKISRPNALFVRRGRVVVSLEVEVVAYDEDEEDDDGAAFSVVWRATNSARGSSSSSSPTTTTVTDDHVYRYDASNATVYRWPCWSTASDDEGEAVVTDIPPSPSSSSSSLSINNNTDKDSDRDGNATAVTTSLSSSDDGAALFVSASDDPDGGAVSVRVFSLRDDPPSRWSDGVAVATGFRRVAATASRAEGDARALWTLDDSTTTTPPRRNDLGGDLDEDNPADELNVVVFRDGDRSPPPPRFGVPDCWSEYRLNPRVSNGRGAQWAATTVVADRGDDDARTDAWCRDERNNRSPAAVFPARSGPSGVAVYSRSHAATTTTTDEGPDRRCPDGVALPASWDGDAFVALRGDYDDGVPGRAVRVPASGGAAVDLWSGGGDDNDPTARPVDVAFDACGRLLLLLATTSPNDGGAILRLRRRQGRPETTDTAAPNRLGPSSLVAGVASAAVVATIVLAFIGRRRRQRRRRAQGASEASSPPVPVPKVVDNDDVDEHVLT